MNLKKYDNLCVRIIDTNGDAFDGICRYNRAAYNEHEYARDEDSLQIENFIFYNSDIRGIRSLEKHTGPYGRFLDPYGRLEEMNIEDGIDTIEDILFSEEKEHVMRMLNCLEKYLDPDGGYELPDRQGVLDLLRKLVSYHSDEEIHNKVRRLLALWE